MPKITRRQDRVRPTESTKCSCMGGRDRAAEHAKPGKTGADHGNPFARIGACIHSQLQATTAPLRTRPGVPRIA